jgi:hypothetical protein
MVTRARCLAARSATQVKPGEVHSEAQARVTHELRTRAHDPEGYSLLREHSYVPARIHASFAVSIPTESRLRRVPYGPVGVARPNAVFRRRLIVVRCYTCGGQTGNSGPAGAIRSSQPVDSTRV